MLSRATLSVKELHIIKKHHMYTSVDHFISVCEYIMNRALVLKEEQRIMS